MSDGRRARPTVSASMNTHQRTIATSAIPSPPQAASSPRDKTGKPGRPKNPRRELLVSNVKFVGTIIGLFLATAVGGVIYLALALGEMKEAKANQAEKFAEVKAGIKDTESRLEKRIERLEAKITHVGMGPLHEGKLLRVKGREITIAEGGAEVVYTLAVDAQVEINSKKARIEDLKVGATVGFFLLPGAKEISRLEATQ